MLRYPRIHCLFIHGFSLSSLKLVGAPDQSMEVVLRPKCVMRHLFVLARERDELALGEDGAYLGVYLCVSQNRLLLVPCSGISVLLVTVV